MKNLIVALAACAALMATPVVANEYASQLEDLAKTKLQTIALDSGVIKAVTDQNYNTSGYDQGKIDTLDKKWRAEVDNSSKPMIDGILAKSISSYLKKVQEQSEGLFTEIFIMDAKGLNVGQSVVTSDYWQGDEGKWKNTYSKGAQSVDISDVEKDDSTQTFQSQVSVPVLDTAGNPIGAITFGVNVEML
jgi:hypothetical protein